VDLSGLNYGCLVWVAWKDGRGQHVAAAGFGANEVDLRVKKEGEEWETWVAVEPGKGFVRWLFSRKVKSGCQ